MNFAYALDWLWYAIEAVTKGGAYVLNPVEIWSGGARDAPIVGNSLSIGLALWAEFSPLRRFYLLTPEHV